MITNKGLHAAILEKTKEQMKILEDDIANRKQELKEAVSMGDLRENSEYVSAKSDLTFLLEEQRYCKELLDMPILPIRNTDIIEPGCTIHIKMYGPYKQPQLLHGSNIRKELSKFSLTGVQSNNNTDNKQTTLKQDKVPDFEGILLFGGSTPRHTCSSDHIFLEDTPVGKGINGKPSGIYEIEVPAGFMLVDVRKVKEYEAKNIETGYKFKK